VQRVFPASAGAKSFRFARFSIWYAKLEKRLDAAQFDVVTVDSYDVLRCVPSFFSLSCRRRRISVADIFHRSLFLAGPAGQLEAMLWTTPNSDPPFVVVVCHPHPLFGGTMHNKVVFQTAKAFHRRGAQVLRFNFRGVGLSEGVHDRGQGERDDARTAIDYLAKEFPHAPILVAGFSFGSLVGLRVGSEDSRVSKLIGLGIPANHSDVSFLAASTKPKLIIQGGNDQYGSREKIEAAFATLAEPKQLAIVEDADHFFTGKLEQVTAAIDEWITEMFPATTTRTD
jgi:alpha/beta superfamily hydrolase